MSKKKSITQVVDGAALTESTLTKEQLRAMLVQDMRGCVVFMNEVMGIPEAVSALTDVYYNRYLELMARRNQVPDPDGVPDVLKKDEEIHNPNQTKMFDNVRE